MAATALAEKPSSDVLERGKRAGSMPVVGLPEEGLPRARTDLSGHGRWLEADH